MKRGQIDPPRTKLLSKSPAFLGLTCLFLKKRRFSEKTFQNFTFDYYYPSIANVERRFSVLHLLLTKLRNPLDPNHQTN